MSHNHQQQEQASCPLAIDSVDVKLIVSELKQQSRDLEEIKTAITGNTKLGIQGLVKRLDVQELDIERLKKWRDNINLRVAYTAGIVSGITFGGLEGIKALIKAIEHKP